MAGNLKELLNKANNVMGKANQVMNAANSAIGTANEIDNTYEYYKKRQAFKNSKEGQAQFAKAARLDKISNFVATLTVILWLVQIIGTIVLCVGGNDMILAILHL